MKAWKLVLAGLLPVTVGLLLNGLIIAFMDVRLLYGLTGILFLLAWAWLGWRLCAGKRGVLAAAALAHLPTLLALLLVCYQTLVHGGFWMNFLGLLTQVAFLPASYLAARCLFWMPSIGMPAMCIVSFILYYAVFCVGGLLRKRL